MYVAPMALPIVPRLFGCACIGISTEKMHLRGNCQQFNINPIFLFMHCHTIAPQSMN